MGVPTGRVSATLALSAALHAVMLAGAPAPSGAGPAPAARPAALQVRLVTAQAPAAAAPSKGTAKARPAASAVKTGPQPRAADDPRYWRASELDSKPIPLTPIEPSAPASAGDKPGRVLARVLINESGRADAVRVELSEPQAIFDEAVKNAFAAARYRPGMKGGRSVKSQMLVEITFHGKDERPADSALPR